MSARILTTEAPAPGAPTAETVPAKPLLQVRALHKSFGAINVLRGVDLTVNPGEVSFVIGPSGGGKSTLIRCINFLETPNACVIMFDGRLLCREEGNVSTV